MSTRRQFGSIRKRASGRWQAHYTDHNGQRVAAPHTFRAKVDAQVWLADVRKAVDRDLWSTLAAPEKVRFGDYAREYVDGRQVAGRPIKPRTRDHYNALLADHIAPAFGDMYLNEITPTMVRDWYRKTLTGRPTMRAHAYALLKAIMASAVTDELATANPCRIRGAGTTKRQVQINPATPSELRALTEHMPDRLKLMVSLGSWCALRFGEVVELRRKDVDVAGEVVHVRRAAVRTKDGVVVGDPKSQAGTRTVTVPPHVVDEIRDHLDNHVGASPEALLFPADHGGTLAPSTLSRHWDKARKAAGRPDLRFHDLRHTGGTMAAISGATLAETMARLGHSSPQAAMRYQHASDVRAREIAERLSKLADL